MSRILPAKAVLWTLLSVPAATILYNRLAAPELFHEEFLHPTGEWSARFLIVALMLTPLSQVLPGRDWVRWLVRHRRAFGVAAFLYAVLHLAFYVLDMETVANMMAEIGAVGIWTGWLALLLMVPLALTSNDAAMRRLKAGWKKLQRLAYPAGLLTLVHWMFVHDGLIPALVNFAPLAALQGWRLVRFARSRSAGGQRPQTT